MQNLTRHCTGAESSANHPMNWFHFTSVKGDDFTVSVFCFDFDPPPPNMITSCASSQLLFASPMFRQFSYLCFC